MKDLPEAGPWEFKCCDKEVTVMQVIRTTNLRRGDGKETPIRAITQFWSMDGDLLAEVDPLARLVPPCNACADSFPENCPAHSAPAEPTR